QRSGATQRRLCKAPEPDGNLALWPWIQCGTVDTVERPLEVHKRLRPEAAQEIDLFSHSAAAGAEILTQCCVFDVVPPDSDTESQPPAGQQIQVRRLPGHEHGLALGQDEDAG